MKLLLSSFKYFLLIIFISSCATTKAQNNNASFTTKKTTSPKALALYKKGVEATRQNKYDKAITYYQKAFKKDNQFVDALIGIGGLYYEQKDFAQARNYFEQATQMAPAYKPKIYYTLGVMASTEKKYAEAIKQIEHYLTYPKINKRRKKAATKKLANIKFTANAIQNPLPFKPINLGKNINSTDPDYLPSFTADEQFLIFTRRVNHQEDFYISKKVDGVFQPAIPMTEINTDKNEGAQCISSDGQYMAMTVCGRERSSYGSCDIFASVKRNGKWLQMRNIGKEINSPHWDAQPSLTANGDALYFASERPGGKGQRDIWVSYRTGRKWGKPLNLGDAINTDGADQAPFIHPDGKTLYFMSDGHPGMGEADLFMSKKQADGSWSQAKNLGYPINDAGQQGALVVSLDGQKGYFAGPKDSAGEGVFFGAIDIFEFELPPALRPDPVTYVKAVVFDEKEKPLIAQIQVVDLGQNKIYHNTMTNEAGSFISVLPSGKNYALNVSKEGYFFHSENFELTHINNIKEPYELIIHLRKIPEPSATPQKTKPVILRNVFFDSGLALLKTDSYYELDKLVNLLKSKPEMRIQINGHTDNVGKPNDNMKLSEQRAKAVYSYLINKGIAAARLTYKGFGESMPIEDNQTPEGRKNNRRTEFEQKR